jgi:general secretion pathway protein H
LQDDGFTMIEAICVLAMVALLAAIVLPALPNGTSRARLQAYALETAAMLKADRYAAMRRQSLVMTKVDARQRTIRSGSTDHVIRLPVDVRFDALLAARCDRGMGGSAIEFFPSGASCGGVIAFTREGRGFELRVNWLTGGVELVSLPPL